MTQKNINGIEVALDDTKKKILSVLKIERKHLTLRTRLKGVACNTICFSKSETMHDIVLGRFINRYELGIEI